MTSLYPGGYPWFTPPLSIFWISQERFSHINCLDESSIGGVCSTCQHFVAELELPGGIEVGITTRFADDKAVYRTWVPRVCGQCLYFHPLVIIDLPQTSVCPYYEKKANELQFEDTAMTDVNAHVAESPYVGPTAF